MPKLSQVMFSLKKIWYHDETDLFCNFCSQLLRSRSLNIYRGVLDRTRIIIVAMEIEDRLTSNSEYP